jgi:gamma-glutamylcyclotransferase (GGCT)/AIG2-like uncharacterized protein YtfP
MQVFVYGSLRAGGWYQNVIEPYVDVREPAWLEGMVLYQVSEQYPGMVAGAGVVHGEVVTLRPAQAEEALHALDKLEGFVGPGNPQNEYEREWALVRTASGELVGAWVYRWLGSTEGYPQVPDGDWIRHWQHQGGEFTCR